MRWAYWLNIWHNSEMAVKHPLPVDMIVFSHMYSINWFYRIIYFHDKMDRNLVRLCGCLNSWPTLVIFFSSCVKFNMRRKQQYACVVICTHYRPVWYNFKSYTLLCQAMYCIFQRTDSRISARCATDCSCLVTSFVPISTSIMTCCKIKWTLNV